MAAWVAALAGCNEQAPASTIAGAKGAGTHLAGRAAAIAAPLVLSNTVADIGVDEARRANSAFAFSKERIEPAHPIFYAGPGAGALSRDDPLQCLTAAVYYEAGGEPLQGERAVAQVVLNRVRHPSFPNSVCAVVYQGAERRTGCQFTFTCDGSLARSPAPDRWLRAERVAERALKGGVEPSVGMATHYHADWVFPYWAPTLRKLAKIGPHIFYTWPGGWGRRRAFTQQPVWDDAPRADQPVVELAAGAPFAAPQAVPVRSPLAADSGQSALREGPRLEQGAAPPLIADVRRGTLVVDGQ